MKTQEDILKRLRDFRVRPELDPLKFKEDMLLKFASFDTLEDASKKLFIGREDWEHIKLTQVEAIRQLHLLLKSAFNHALACKSISVERAMQMIEVILWLLEDDDAIEFMKDEDYRLSFGLPIVQYLIKRYGDEYEACSNR